MEKETFGHWLVAITVRALMRLLFKVEVRGTMEKHDRMLIVANHQSFLDGVLLGAFLPIQPFWLVHTTQVRKWYFRIGLSFLPHMAVDTTSPFAMKAAIGMIERGRPVMIFPEGRITVTGGLMKTYDGPGFMAAKTGAVVVPLRIEGSIYCSFASRMKGDFPQQAFPKITLTIHPARRIVVPEGLTGKVRRRKAGDQMRRIMQLTQFLNEKPTTVWDQFLEAVELHGRDRDMIEDAQLNALTYGQILKGSLALGRLLARETSEGEAVAVLMPNAAPLAPLLLGLMAMRRVPAILNFTSGAEGMASALKAAQVKLLVTSRAFLEKAKLTAAVAKLSGVRILYLEDARGRLTAGDKLWLMLRAMPEPWKATPQGKPEDPAVILFTSGSEGKPKGVVLSHRAVLANIGQMLAAIEVGPRDKFMSAMPAFHSFGLTIGLILPLLHGCRIFLYPSPLHYRIVPELTYDRDCTLLFATNTFLRHYANRANPFDLCSVRYIISGAERLTDDVKQTYYEKFGQRIYEGYGATECAPVISGNVPMAYRPGTVGEFMAAMEWKIEPVEGIDEGGLLHVRGPNVMLGYMREEKPGVIEPPRSIFGEGWYATGDIAKVDDDGYLTLLGRKKRFAKVAGEMVSLEVVENLAEAASPRKHHAALNLPDTGRGEMIVLFTEDPNLKRDQLQQAQRTLGGPELAVPRRIVRVDRIPLLGNGKKDYTTLGKQAPQLLEASKG